MRIGLVVFGAALSLAVFVSGWRTLFSPLAPLGDFEKAALLLERSGKKEWCDLQTAKTRLGLAKIVDHFRPKIQGLFQSQTGDEFPEMKMEAVGPILLRASPPKKAGQEYEVSSWSWEDARDKFRRTQANPEAKEVAEQWRAIDTAVRYLLEQDLRRLVFGSAQLEPEKTWHLFQPNPSVRRLDRKTWEVRIKVGDFAGSEKKLENIIRRQWWSHGNRVVIRWVGEEDVSAYTLRANRRSSRSFVDHRSQIMVIAHLAWTRTVSHELGHILGFDDHYYSVWNGQNCYYQQKARLGDLMSHSETGEITKDHWRLLEKAYPEGLGKPSPQFRYVYGATDRAP